MSDDKEIVKTEKESSKQQGIYSNIAYKDDVSEEADEKPDIKFLLVEFSEIGQFWRHTDSRIETTINYYITVGAVVLPGVVLLYQAISDTRLFILATLPIIGALIIIGLFLVARVTNSDILKAEYILSLNLIRRYFVDNNLKIAPYLYLPIAEPSTNLEVIRRQLLPYFHHRIILVVNCANSILFGLMVCGFLWLVASQFLSFRILITVAFIISVVSLATLTWFSRKAIRQYEVNES